MILSLSYVLILLLFFRNPQPSCSFKQLGVANRLQKTKLYAIKGPVRYSADDWLSCLQSLPSSRILKRTKSNILLNMFWTTLVTILIKFKKNSFSLPSTVHSILGSALGLLLVFRTNSAYDRFWEGRKSVGKVVIACRDIARLSCYLPKSYHSYIAEFLVAFTIILKQHLQGERDVNELEPFINDVNEIGRIQAKTNRPLYLLQCIEKKVNEGLQVAYCSDPCLPKYIEKGFLDAFENLSNQIGVTERIVKQPVPLSYSRHTSRFLSLYLFTLPFAFAPTTGWSTIPIVTGICWAFVSILEIGHFIEDPFNKETQNISLNQITFVVCSDISGISIFIQLFYRLKTFCFRCQSILDNDLSFNLIQK